MVYRFDAKRGMLEPHTVPWIKLKPGSGPSHVAFHPRGSFAYLINELDSTLAALHYDSRKGTFRTLHVLSTLPEGFRGENTCADLHVALSGGFLYGLNRGHDSVAVSAVNGLGYVMAAGPRSARDRGSA